MSAPVCVIVGAGPGNGAAFARRFSSAGYQVALLARRQEGLDTLTREIAGTRAYAYDATAPADASRVFARIREEVGPPQSLIYNASTREFGDIDVTSPEAFERAWRVNAFGCLLAAQQVIPAMRAQGEGSIIVIGATASLKGAAGFVAFASAKAAQRSLAQSLARQPRSAWTFELDLRPFGESW